SRRRHTRSKRDWSSDVCSSDLHLASWTAGLLLLIAFCPKIIVAWVILPGEVLGPLFLFLSSFAVIGGTQMIGSRMLDNRRTLAKIGRASCRERVSCARVESSEE